MGRKKGRQCGQYARKSQRAAHLTELRERASEAYQHHGHHHGGASASAAAAPPTATTTTSIPTSTSPRLDEELPTPRSTRRSPGMTWRETRTATASASASTLLRRMLEERRWEDRAEEREGRRRMHRLHRQMALSAGSQGGKVVDGSSCEGENEVGWLMRYETEGDRLRRELHSDSGTRLRRRRRFEGVPTLASLCASALGPVITDYVAALGVDVVRDAVSSLPPHIIAALSVGASAGAAGGLGVGGAGGATDDVVSVLVGCGGGAGGGSRGPTRGGAHFVDRLTLHAAVDTPREVRGSVTPGVARTLLLTDEGISQLIPRRIQDPSGACRLGAADDVTGGDDDHHRRDVADSWESIVDVDRHLNIGGCPRLVRLELANLSSHRAGGGVGVSRETMFRLLRGCPTLTHLGIVNCFHDDVSTGPDMLLNRRHGVGAVLKRLKVLDVSNNAWLNDSVLTAFVSRFCAVRCNGDGGEENRRAGTVLHQLSLISVTGCSNVTARVVGDLCRQYGIGAGRHPLVSAEVQRSASSTSSSPPPPPATGTQASRRGGPEGRHSAGTTVPRTSGAYVGGSGYRPQPTPAVSSPWDAGGFEGGSWCADDGW